MRTSAERPQAWPVDAAPRLARGRDDDAAPFDACLAAAAQRVDGGPAEPARTADAGPRDEAASPDVGPDQAARRPAGARTVPVKRMPEWSRTSAGALPDAGARGAAPSADGDSPAAARAHDEATRPDPGARKAAPGSAGAPVGPAQSVARWPQAMTAPLDPRNDGSMRRADGGSPAPARPASRRPGDEVPPRAPDVRRAMPGPAAGAASAGPAAPAACAVRPAVEAKPSVAGRSVPPGPTPDERAAPADEAPRATARSTPSDGPRDCRREDPDLTTIPQALPPVPPPWGATPSRPARGLEPHAHARRANAAHAAPARAGDPPRRHDAAGDGVPLQTLLAAAHPLPAAPDAPGTASSTAPALTPHDVAASVQGAWLRETPQPPAGAAASQWTFALGDPLTPLAALRVSGTPGAGWALRLTAGQGWPAGALAVHADRLRQRLRARGQVVERLDIDDDTEDAP